MATTTNYGWTTPDDTALVKDGASAIRTLGSSVDTTTKNLNPETTLADLAYRSSTANVKTRLGIGSTGQVLTVAGGVPTWATLASGGMTLLSTTTLSGASTTVSSISQDYKNLQIIVSGLTNSTTDGLFLVQPNASSSISTTTGQSGTTNYNVQDDDLRLSFTAITRTDANNAWNLTINNYASTTSNKSFIGSGYAITAAGSTAIAFSGGIKTNTAISSLVFTNQGETMTAGTVLIYGVK